MSSAAALAERPTPKAQRTRRHLLETSLALFKEKGFDQTSMRDIAARAGLSLGATYYHFRSKEDLVFAFYAETQEEAAARSREMLGRTGSFRERMRDVLEFKLEQLTEYRSFIVVLARSALDLSNPLSPFSSEARAARHGAIEILEEAIEQSDIKAHHRLRPRLPRLLWLYEMGIVFFWIHDASPGQERTRKIVDSSLSLLETLLALTARRLPGVGRSVGLIADLLDAIAFWDEPETTS